jgi:zinc protease
MGMNKIRWYVWRIFLLSGVIAWFFLGGPAHAEKIPGDNDCLTTKWPAESAGLVGDPTLVRGKLANGFRYVLNQHQEPKNRVAIYLAVQAGSLNETDDQRGLAHFLEHMMFNGTDNFPAGTLVEYFQSIGMGFGNDANAHTGYDQTVYNIILPNGSEKELDTGLLVMADYARRAQLQDVHIDKERGVILAEKRARDSAAYRIQVASMEFAFRGTKLAERMVIGDENTLKKADRNLLKSYYDAWYRPDNMVVVVVGDMDPDLAEKVVRKHFAELSPDGPRPKCPEFGKLTNRGTETFYRFAPELGKTNVAIESFRDMPLQNDSIELQREELIRSMGEMIMGYRLQQLQERKGSLLARATYGSGDIINRIGYGSIATEIDHGKWQESLSLLDRTLRQAIDYGFTDLEVERSKKEILAELEENVLTAKSKDSRTIAEKIIRQLSDNRVYQSAEQEKALYGPLLEQIHTAEVNRAFREVWNQDGRLVSVTGDVQLGDDGAAAIARYYQQSELEGVVGPTRGEKETFPYLTIPPPPAQAPERKYYKDIDVEKVVFANGLIVNLKKTDYQENSVQVIANFGAGEQSEPAPGMAMVVEHIINSSGSGQLTRSAVDALVAGSSIKLRFRIDEAAFSWVGSTLFKDFELFTQILHTMLYDPGFRENQFGNVMTNVELMYQKMSREIDGAMALNVQPFLADQNPHFGLPSWESIAKLDFPGLAKWVRSFAQPKDLEISVVGAFDRDEVVEIMNKYFGGARLEKPRIAEAPLVLFPAGGALRVNVDTSIDKSLVVVAWPTDDFWDIHRTRRLNMLASVLEDRVRKIVRENLGATYSPTVANFNSRVYPGYGFLIARLIVEPGNEERVIAEILKISEQLHKEGINTDELVRARKPMVTSLMDSVRTNQYWLTSVLSLSSRYSRQLDWPTTILSDFSAINEQELSTLAAKYLDNTQAAIARAVPGETLKQENGRTAGTEKLAESGAVPKGVR